MNRRSMLGLLAAAPLLAACSTPTRSGSGAAASAKVKLPTYIPFQGPTPDLPGNAQGLDPAYLKFPKRLVDSVKGIPAGGQPITALGWTDSAVPPPMSNNAFWQQLNTRLGAPFKFDITSDYPTKFNTMIAGGDIPELVWFPPNQGLTKVAELLEAKFADLTPYLSGDAVKAYPNLANLGDFAWRTAIINGRIWGPPVSHGIFGQIYECNKAHWDEVGGPQCATIDEFVGKLKELTRPAQHRWAMAPVGSNDVVRFGELLGMPNTWRLNKDGSLTYYLETDEYAQALELVRKVVEAGCFHPDQNADPYEVLFPQGTISTLVDDMPGFILAPRKYKDLEIAGIVPFGDKAVYHLGYGSLGFTAINKSASPERVKQLLRVLDFLAAPFGSSEWLFLHYGSEGEHFTFDKDGLPQLTEKGAKETTLNNPIGYLSQGPEFIYAKGAAYTYDIQQKLLKIAIANPVAGHYSDTAVSGRTKLPIIGDLVTDMILGRKPLTYLQTLRSDWKRQGGDKIREEYQQSIAKGGPS